MAFEIATGLIAGGAALLGQGGQAYATGKMNAKNRKFQEEMWKKDADQNIAQWNMQNQYNEGMWEKQKSYNQSVWDQENQYNSPESQMQRFRDAGLNPNLIYGQSNMGGTLDAAQRSDAPAIPGKNTQAVQGKVPEFDLAQGIFAYMDFKTRSLQNNNLEAQNEAIKAGIARTNAETLATISGTGLKDQLRSFREDANPLGLDALRLKNRQSNQAYEMKEKYYEMDSERMAQWLKHNRASILRMASQNLTDSKQRDLMDTEINLNKMGIGKNSPWWLRLMGNAIQQSEIIQPKESPHRPGLKIFSNPTWDEWGSFGLPDK